MSYRGPQGQSQTTEYGDANIAMDGGGTAITGTIQDGTTEIPVTLQPKYRFTPDELRALRECNRESFYFRCLPIGSALGTAAYFGVKYGYLTPNVRFGAVPKVVLASTVGYFIGKFSYQGKCVEKLMNLPNSPLAELLKKQRAGGKLGGFQESLGLEPSFSSAFSGMEAPSSSSDPGTETSNLFTDVGDTQPLNSFDSMSADSMDYSRKSAATVDEMQMDLPPKAPQFFTSYDELRKQNREEYEKKAHSSGIQGVSSGGPGSKRYVYTTPQPGQANPTPPAQGTQGRRQQTNAYGDVWEEKTE